MNVSEYPDDTYEDMTAVMLRSPFYLTKALLPKMKEKGRSGLYFSCKWMLFMSNVIPTFNGFSLAFEKIVFILASYSQHCC